MNEETSHVSYSLDGHDNVTITGNTTLAELSIGPHNLTLYAKDLVGNTVASQNVMFTTEEELNFFDNPCCNRFSYICSRHWPIYLLMYIKRRKRQAFFVSKLNLIKYARMLGERSTSWFIAFVKY